MRTLAILVGLVAVAVAVPALAPAKSSPGVVRQGKCSGSASWKLKAKLADGLIETEFEVDQNIAGRAGTLSLPGTAQRSFAAHGLRARRAGRSPSSGGSATPQDPTASSPRPRLPAAVRSAEAS
jgi:hypothetical protein